MSEESASCDPVGLVRRQLDALGRRDLDGVMSEVADDIVFDGRALGDHFEGRAAVDGFLAEWFGNYEALHFDLEEVEHLGGGIVFAVVTQHGRPAGGAGLVRQREGWVYVCVRGSIARLKIFDVDEGRTAAEHLAKAAPEGRPPNTSA